MCYATTCSSCGKTTWAGCGMHVDAVKRSVPAKQWCTCGGGASSSSSGGLLAKLFSPKK